MDTSSNESFNFSFRYLEILGVEHQNIYLTQVHLPFWVHFHHFPIPKYDALHIEYQIFIYVFYKLFNF